MRRVDVVARSNLSFPAKWLAVFMAHHENRKGEVITTVADIRGWTGLSKAAIRDGIDELIHAAFISEVQPFKPGPNSSAKYMLTWKDAPQGSASPDETSDEIRHKVAQLVSDGAEKVLEPRVRADLLPLSLSSPDVLSSPVLENKELRQESVSEMPAWLTNLRATPTYDLNRDAETRLISRVTAGGFTAQRLAEASTALAAKWESVKWSPSNKRGYKRIDLTFFNWLSREGLNGHGKSQNDVSPIEAGRTGGFADSSRYET